MGVAAVKAPDSTLVRSLKDVAAGTVAGIGITLVGHPFGQQLTCRSRHFPARPRRSKPAAAAPPFECARMLTKCHMSLCMRSGYPTDTLKVRLQTQSHTNPIYSGLSDCVKKTWAAEGAKGVASPLVGQMFFNAVQVSPKHTATCAGAPSTREAVH
jgi:hypothetical protein